MDPKNLHDLFLMELQDMASAEEQLIEALPKLAKAATNPQLKQAFQSHLKETQEHLAKVMGLLESFGVGRGRKKCAGTAGILSEGEDTLEHKVDAASMDAAIIAGAQKSEHYEISSYGAIKAWAAAMGHSQAVEVIDSILAQEKAADQKLSTLADAINPQAASGVKDSDETRKRRAG